MIPVDVHRVRFSVAKIEALARLGRLHAIGDSSKALLEIIGLEIEALSSQCH